MAVSALKNYTEARKESRLILNSTRVDAERIANLLIVKKPTRTELVELANLIREHVRGIWLPGGRKRSYVSRHMGDGD